ncbi:MAG: hypothetical protein AAF063_17520 [Cyanobacteria bacterium J06643_5]
MNEIEAAMRLVESDIIPIELQKIMLTHFQRCQQGIKEAFSLPYQDARSESPTIP